MLLTRGGFFSPSLDGGLPLLRLFSPRQRSNSANRPSSAAVSARSSAFSACKAVITASLLVAAGALSPQGVSSGGAIDTLTRTYPWPVKDPPGTPETWAVTGEDDIALRVKRLTFPGIAPGTARP